MDTFEVRPVIADTPLADQVEELYTLAFPRVDKFPFDALCRFSESGAAGFSAYFDDGVFCGFSYTLKADKYLFVLYLAIDPRFRSMGYGTEILRRLAQENPGFDLVLDIELPHESASNAEQRYRRRAFYERNGFWCTGDVFGVDDNLYLIMTTAQEWNCDEFLECARQTHGYLPDYYFGDIHHFEDEVRLPAGR